MRTAVAIHIADDALVGFVGVFGDGGVFVLGEGPVAIIQKQLIRLAVVPIIVAAVAYEGVEVCGTHTEW